ncbi:MAG: glycerophosphodiester phosphodiesterase [Spirochaetales bacterium]
MRRFLLILAIVVAALALVVLVLGAILPKAGEHPAITNHSWRVIAHQGGNHLWPDNTMLAFRNAAASGVDALEMDVHATRDGVPVVIHDSTVDRTTDGSGTVWEMTLEEIQSLDAAYRWPHHLDTNEYPYRGTGITIPTLEEVLRAFPDVPMAIEIKQAEPSIVVTVGEMLQRYDREQNTIVASFSPAVMREFRESFPGFATSGVEPEIRTFFVLKTAFLGWVYPPPMEAFQVPERSGGLHVITRRFVSSAHRRNINVQAWTINDRESMHRILDTGVDGIITDEPLMLMEVLAERDER